MIYKIYFQKRTERSFVRFFSHLWQTTTWGPYTIKCCLKKLHIQKERERESARAMLGTVQVLWQPLSHDVSLDARKWNPKQHLDVQNLPTICWLYCVVGIWIGRQNFPENTWPFLLFLLFGRAGLSVYPIGLWVRSLVEPPKSHFHQPAVSPRTNSGFRWTIDVMNF